MRVSRRGLLVGASAAVGAAVLPRWTAGAAPAGAAPADTAATGRAAPADTAGARVLPAAADQTPIDIRTNRVVAWPPQPMLRFHYPSVDLELEYVNKDGSAGCGVRDHEETVEAVVPAGAAWVTLDGVRHDLLQFHFHTPSEHLVDGRAFPMEQHFVHRSAAGDLLVVGLFLRSGGHGTVQDRVLAALPVECGEHLHIPHVDLAAALPRDLRTYRYLGSLTTAPFDTDVRWHVLHEPVRVDRRTIDRFEDLFPAGNSREVQPVGRRVVRIGPGRLQR